MTNETESVRVATDEDLVAAFRQNLDELMRLRSVTIVEIAEATGVSQGSLYKVMQGKTKRVSAIDATRVAEFFGTTVERMVGVPEDPRINEIVDLLSQLDEREREFFQTQLEAVAARPASQSK